MTKTTPLTKLNDFLEKLQPPRQGLVPKSGDWEHPYRWVLPEGEKQKPGEELPEVAQTLLGREGLIPLPHTTDITYRPSTGEKFDLKGNRLDVLRELCPEARKKSKEKLEELISDSVMEDPQVKTGLISGLVDDFNLPPKHLMGVSRIYLKGENSPSRPKWREEEGFKVFGMYENGDISLFPSATPEILLHEIGHSIYHLKTTNFRLPNILVYGIERLYSIAKDYDEGFVSEYAKTNVKEFFAESYAVYIQDRANLLKRNQDLTEIMDDIVELLDSVEEEPVLEEEAGTSKKLHLSSLTKLTGWVNKNEPPRQGLVPKTGDWEHPYRWVLPEEENPS